MDKRASRTIRAFKKFTDFILNNISKEFVLISKWGGDGSNGLNEDNFGGTKQRLFLKS
jgi:hypothetical protein